jgi:hypothetical protein
VAKGQWWFLSVYAHRWDGRELTTAMHHDAASQGLVSGRRGSGCAARAGPDCKDHLFYVPRRPPADLGPIGRHRRTLLYPAMYAVSGVGTDGSVTGHDGEDVREDFWTDPVAGCGPAARVAGASTNLPAPETRAQVAAAVARGERFVG